MAIQAAAESVLHEVEDSGRTDDLQLLSIKIASVRFQSLSLRRSRSQEVAHEDWDEKSRVRAGRRVRGLLGHARLQKIECMLPKLYAETEMEMESRRIG